MISKRLRSIASLIDKKVKVYDIGCNHGLLSIFLSKTNKVVASDILDYCIIETTNNINKRHITNIDVIKSDGLSNLNPDKNDTLVLAGLGTYVIINILKKEANKLTDTIIIQSNNNLDTLRYNMDLLGYYIDTELDIYDYKYYSIIKFKKGHKEYSTIDYILGPNRDIDYLNYVLKRYIDMYNDIPSKYIDRRNKVNDIINLIKKEMK